MIIVKVYGDGELLTILYYELEFDLSSSYLVVPEWSRELLLRDRWCVI